MPNIVQTWSCSHTLVLIFFTAAVAGLFALSWGVSQDPPELRNIKKTFGLGQGPFYLDTFNVSGEDLKISIYEEYFGYKKLTKQIGEEELLDYKKWYAANTCQAGCHDEEHSICSRGICWCDDGNPLQYGQCRPRSEAEFLGNKEKYRKPELPPLPDHCYVEKMVNSQLKKVIDDLQAHKPECRHKEKHPNQFDLETQTCNAAVPSSCFDRDLNLVCRDDSKCHCRHDMRWNTGRMQCELYLGVDCTGEAKVDLADYKAEKEMLLGRKLVLSSTAVDLARVKTVYCNLLEGHSMQYIKNRRGGKSESDILGYMNAVGLIFFIAGCAFGFMWLLMIYGMIRALIQSCDPRNALNEMSTRDKIAALGTLAGQEMMERQQEGEDNRRTALMQGQNA